MLNPRVSATATATTKLICDMVSHNASPRSHHLNFEADTNMRTNMVWLRPPTTLSHGTHGSQGWEAMKVKLEICLLDLWNVTGTNSSKSCEALLMMISIHFPQILFPCMHMLWNTWRRGLIQHYGLPKSTVKKEGSANSVHPGTSPACRISQPVGWWIIRWTNEQWPQPTNHKGLCTWKEARKNIMHQFLQSKVSDEEDLNMFWSYSWKTYRPVQTSCFEFFHIY